MSLQDLEDILKSESVVYGSDYSNHEEYMLGYEKYVDNGGAVFSEVTRQALKEEALKIIARSDKTEPFRVCSIGFGSGILEGFLLDEMSATFPGIQVEFVGVDINKKLCKNLEKNISKFTNIKSVVYNQDIEAGIPESKPFHFVMLVNSIYYLESCLPYLIGLLHDDGSAFVVISTEDTMFLPDTKLWNKCHPGKCTLYSERLPSVLEALRVSYVLRGSTKKKLDLSEAIRDNFASMENKCLLNFLVHTKLENQSEKMKEACIQYFKSVVKDELGSLVTEFEEDIYVLHK